MGTATLNGVVVPTILCHADSYTLGLGSNHSDVNHWFPKFEKSMNTAREDVAKLIKSATDIIDTTANSKEYKIVTSLNRYSTASDAKAMQNSVGTYEAGTYYIYSKYPNGVDGMLNISKDSSGNSAGSWINPSENKISTPVVEEELYRVRISWSDATTQIGAYKNLSNAISMADTNAAQGYKVFDSSGTVIYTPQSKPTEKPVEEPEKPKDDPVTTEPEQPVQPTPSTPTYPTSTNIIGFKDENEYCRKNLVKAVIKIKSIYADFDNSIAEAFFKIAPVYRIDPMMAISQSILETGWFRFQGSSVSPEQHNYCGLGATGGGVSGASFDTIEDGVHAQCQHLYAYGCSDELPEGVELIDPRFKYVTRSKSTTWEGLAGKWAVPGYDASYSSIQEAIDAGATYGQKILRIRSEIEIIELSGTDIESYYHVEVPEVPDNTKNTDTANDINTDGKENQSNVSEEPLKPDESDIDDKQEQLNVIQSLLIKCIEAIISFIKSIFKK